MIKMKTKLVFLLNVLFLLTMACSNDDKTITVQVDNFVTEIDEFPKSNQVIGTIPASTNGGHLTFSITTQTPEDAFSIDSKTGELTVLNKDNYNFLINPVISGTVKVQNGDIIDYSSVTINVKDVERVYDGYAEIKTQDQLNRFGANFYDRINGSISLSGENITNTKSLSSIKFINGDCFILGTSIEDIDGFSNANFKDDAVIQIVNNQKLKNLNGFQSVAARISFMEIRMNPQLIHIDGLKNITNVTDQIIISDTDSLTNLNGLSGINNTVRFLRIYNNKGLTNVTGLSNISITDEFYFSNNDLVTSLSNMARLIDIKRLTLVRNDALEDINGLSELRTCRELGIAGNTYLKNLDGLIHLRNVNAGGLSISGNDSLKDFCGLRLLASVSTVGFDIRDNYYNPTQEDINNGDCSVE